MNLPMLRATIGFLVYLLLVPALLFISAGTLNWPMAWVYTGLSLVSIVGSRLIILRRDPDLLHERAIPPVRPGDTLPAGSGCLVRCRF